MQIYEELIARGLIAQVTNEEEIKKMVNEGKADFIDGAVSSDSNNNVDSIPGSFGSYLGGMSGILGALDGIVIFRMVNLFLDQLWNCFFAVSSGNGIDDENYSFFQAHVSSLAWFRSTKIILFA